MNEYNIAIEYNGQRIIVDQDGYLQNFTDWSVGLAVSMGHMDGLELTGQHIEVLLLMREFYQQNKISPMPKIIIKKINKLHPDGKINIKYIYSLFNKYKGACKYAGIKPVGCT